MRNWILVMTASALMSQVGYAQSPPAISPSTYTVVSRELGFHTPAPIASDLRVYRQDIVAIETRLGGMEQRDAILAVTNKAVGEIFDVFPGMGVFGEVLLEEVEKQSSAAFDKSRNDIYDAVFAKARARDEAEFERVFGGGISQENYDRAHQMMYGEAPALAKELESRRGQDAESIRAQEIDNLQAAVTRSIALSGQKDEELDRKIAAADARIDTVGRDLEAFTDAVKKEVGAIKESQQALEDAVTIIKGEVGQNSADIAFMQQVLWGQMSAAEQLEGLTSGTFLRDMDVSKRADLQARLETLAKIEKAGVFLSGASSLAHLASKLGVIPEADAANFQHNIQTAQQAANVASLILDQKWFSAAGAATGLFGGSSGPSAEHMAVMRSLEEIKGQLREIQQQNEEIRQSISELRDIVIAGFDRIDQRLDIIQLVLLMGAKNDLAACRNFVGPGLATGQPPQFSSYIKRSDHFAMQRDRYLTCFRFLAGQLERTQLNEVSEFYLNKVWQLDGRPIDDPLYRREAQLALAAFLRSSATEVTPASTLQRCIGKYIATFSSMTAVTPDWVGCSNASLSLGDYGDVDLVEQKFNVPLVAETANVLLALAPYDDLLKYDAVGGITGLRTEADLARVDEAIKPRAFADLLPDANNLLTYAMAQQATISGAAVAPNYVRLLAENSFAGVRKKGTQPCAASVIVQDSSGQAVCSVNRGEDPLGAFQLVANAKLDQLEDCGRQFSWHERGDLIAAAIGCELTDNQLMRENVGLALGQMIVQATSRRQYAAVWGSGDPGFMAVLLRDSDLSWLAKASPAFSVQKRQNGLPPKWFINVAAATGIIAVPLPSPAEASTAAPSMPPAWHDLVKLRNRVGTMHFGAVLAPEITNLDPWTLLRLAESTPELMGR